MQQIIVAVPYLFFITSENWDATEKYRDTAMQARDHSVCHENRDYPTEISLFILWKTKAFQVKNVIVAAIFNNSS